MAAGDTFDHDVAARAFADAVMDRAGDVVASIIVFGSTARGETRGRDSDVDIMVLVDDEADSGGLDGLMHEAAFEVLLEHGIVVSTHRVTTSQYEADRDHPFLRTVRREGRTYV